MKNICILFLCLVLSEIVYPQWTDLNPVPDGNDLNSVFFTDENTGWIAGSEGFITKTTNAGSDWIHQNSNTAAVLNAVKFLNQTTGWIAGNAGTIIKTTDGGLNWLLQASGTTQNLNGLYLYDSNLGWAVGDSGTILKTTNGGISWNLTTIHNVSKLASVDFINPLVGWVVGSSVTNRAVILKTTDGGVHWEDMSDYYTDNTSLNAVKFIDENTGLIGNSIMPSPFRTTDGGHTWRQVKINWDYTAAQNTYKWNGAWTFGVQDFYFSSSWLGYAIVRDWGWWENIIKTTDGGSTWVPCPGVNTFANLNLRSLCVMDQGQIWTVGVEGRIAKSSDDGETFSEYLDLNNDERTINSVFFIDKNTGWAGGQCFNNNFGYGGIILKTTDGGKYWAIQLIGPHKSGERITDLFFIDENNGWAFENNPSELLTTSDGGQTWNVRAGLGNDENYTSPFFINQDTGWAINTGSHAGIYKTTDGGFTWVLKNCQLSSSVYFVNPCAGWAAGPGGLILKSTDGGENWIAENSGTTENLKKVKFFNSNTGLCTGTAGTILFTSDGGENWISEHSGTIEELSSISFVNSGSFWIGGTNGKILSTTDSGNSWTAHDNLTTSSIISLGFFDEHTGWVAGKYIFNYYEESVGITNQESDGLPVSYELYQNYPNPFNPGTTIRFSISRESNVNLSIYNVLGELVSTLVDEEMMPGNYKYEFNASALASGLYLYRIKAGDYVETKKMILLK